MAQSTEAPDQTFSHAQTVATAHAPIKVWGKIKLVITRSVFWAYERGSWQYDLFVLAILLFIFLVPRSWFNDRPTLQLIDLRHQQGFVELSHSKEGRTYLIDARLVESLAPETPEDAIETILRSRVPKHFTVKSIAPVKDRNNVILSYTVVIAQ